MGEGASSLGGRIGGGLVLNIVRWWFGGKAR